MTNTMHAVSEHFTSFSVSAVYIEQQCLCMIAISVLFKDDGVLRETVTLVLTKAT